MCCDNVIVTVVVCTDLLGKEPYRQCGVMVNTMASIAKDARLIPAEWMLAFRISNHQNLIRQCNTYQQTGFEPASHRTDIVAGL